MSQTKELLLVGAGGHAKVVLSVAMTNFEVIAGYLDDNPHLLNQQIHKYPVIGNQHLLKNTLHRAVFSIGDNNSRKKIANNFPEFNAWRTLIHPSAYVHPTAKIGIGTVIFAGAIIQPGVEIGAHCIINTGSTIDHDCKIADYVHIAPGVHLAGNVEIKEGALLGIGTVVTPNQMIGAWSEIGAGSVIINEVKAYTKVVGVPGRVISDKLLYE